MLAEGAVSVRLFLVCFFVRESGHGPDDRVVAALRTLIDGGVETVRRPCIWYIPPLYDRLLVLVYTSPWPWYYLLALACTIDLFFARVPPWEMLVDVG